MDIQPRFLAAIRKSVLVRRDNSVVHAGMALLVRKDVSLVFIMDVSAYVHRRVEPDKCNWLLSLGRCPSLTLDLQGTLALSLAAPD